MFSWSIEKCRQNKRNINLNIFSSNYEWPRMNQEAKEVKKK